MTVAGTDSAFLSDVRSFSAVFPDFALVDNNNMPSETVKKAAHGMFYALTDDTFLGQYRERAYVMMQIRFDGDIGFPGGLIEPEDESLTAGLNREVLEEMGSGSPSLKFEESDFLFAHRCLETGRVLYFYAKRISPEEFRELELNVLKAEEYGKETLGVLRVPLYTMDDGFRGLPQFLTNSFSGNAKLQLLGGLLKAKTHSVDELRFALRNFTA
ncbi:unnamed protein product [Calicophoron daubneyi]|uniref:U8 snoRNA-decapping enzyme n=1 Tax=Calicophoron daubneyi TaxID=300641 RepID=A0AAV2TZ98_CALDB